jgi:hypothetical protein
MTREALVANNQNSIAVAGADCDEMPAFAPGRRLSLQFFRLSSIDQRVIGLKRMLVLS